ncbi:4'-phosphopantetheinyl transferase superfamily protein [Pseudomonas sp. GD03944]|uniref:4'-phosphopantetheinyl transferase family protein n=1 Tax=Pseudomonas sp. GD03944 TaxID=2975409 RepID=UPI00244B2CB6|nr:4'-phosphopantetheinyl transferase superfamily protein [Pseudomonas sp. GD03944]MDH1263388.1 4'-phosphopantetheinyl transferase superfamily protein [Pseudomonas sp. GD03944]
MNDYLPACCTPLADHWPLPHVLAEARLISTRFTPEHLDSQDFARCAIPQVRGVAKRQTEYLAGRLCAREALRRVSGLAVVPGIGEDRAPQWPAGLSGSITHGTGWAAAVVAPASAWRGLGLDVEQRLPVERADRLAPEILTPDEWRRIQHLADEERAWRVSLTFSLKESLFKALYPLTLQRFYFHDAELAALQDDGRATLRLLIDLHPEWLSGTEVQGQFGEFDDHLLSLVAIAP